MQPSKCIKHYKVATGRLPLAKQNFYVCFHSFKCISTISTFSPAKQTGSLPYKNNPNFFLENGYNNGLILRQNGNITDNLFVTTYRDLKNEIAGGDNFS